MHLTFKCIFLLRQVALVYTPEHPCVSTFLCILVTQGKEVWKSGTWSFWVTSVTSFNYSISWAETDVGKPLRKDNFSSVFS